MLVECQVCKKKYKRITHTHLTKHVMTYEDYLQRFPDSKVCSDETSEILTGVGIRKWKEEGYREKVHEPMSAAKIGNKNPLGCSRSEETKRKIGESVSKTANRKMIGDFKNYSSRIKNNIDYSNQKCDQCKEAVNNPIYLNGGAFHSSCLSTVIKNSKK